MKNITFIVIFFFTIALYGQETITAGDFLPEIFYTKQSLIEHYQYNELNYESILFDLENKSNQNVKIIFRDSSRIIYTYSYRDNLAMDTYTLTFNSNKKLIELDCDNKECNDICTYDVPKPELSDVYFTYNRIGQLKQILGYCGDKSYSIRTNYHYNDNNELDSLIYSSGYLDLYTYRKVIFISSTIWSGEDKGSIALILNTQFDYVKWLKYDLYDTAYFNTINNPLLDSYSPFTKNIYDDNNYIYEFDSIGRVTSYVALNKNADYGSISRPVGCDLSADNCGYTSKLDFYYVDNKISGVEFNSFGDPDFDNNCRCVCLMRINYKKEKIKEITFHARLNENEFVFEKKWTRRKGLQYINELGYQAKSQFQQFLYRSMLF